MRAPETRIVTPHAEHAVERVEARRRKAMWASLRDSAKQVPSLEAIVQKFAK